MPHHICLQSNRCTWFLLQLFHWAWPGPCSPSMDGLVVKVCTGEKSESTLSLFTPRTWGCLGIPHLGTPGGSLSHSPRPFSVWPFGPQPLMLTFLGPEEAMECEAKMEVGRSETSQPCLLEPPWMISHGLCEVSRMQGRSAREMESLPLWACSELFSLATCIWPRFQKEEG